MPDFVYEISLNQLAIYFSLIAIGALVAGMLILKPILRLLLGTGPEFNHSVSVGAAGFNLFYGLLLGLLTVTAYQNNERVSQAIQSEATSLGALYSDMESYPEPTRSDVKWLIRDYTLFTIYRDWIAHRTGEFLDGGTYRADAIRRELARFEPRTEGEAILHDAVISAYEQFSSARQQRISGVLTEIPDVLWYAVLVGGAISIILLVFLRMPFRPQLFLGVTTSFFLGVILFVIVVLDDPLRGESGLEPDPLVLLWERRMVWDDEG